MNDLEFARRNALAAPSDVHGSFARETGGPSPLLIQLLTVLRRRTWVIVGAIVGALLLGLIVTLLMTPRYTASSTIEIRRETGNFVEVEGAEAQSTAAMDQEFYNTQYGLFRSRVLAERVAVNLRLFDSQEFFEMLGGDEAGNWFENGRPAPGASTREERVHAAGRILLENFAVAPERLSRLVGIQFSSPDPELSRRVVDAWATGFIQLALERRFEATSYARRFLESRLAQLRTRIDQSERALVGYASRQGIVNLPSSPVISPTGTVTTGERSLVADDLSNLNTELARATADRIRAQSRLGAGGGEVGEALENDAISGLRQRRAELAAEYARLMVQFEPGYPPAQAIQTQVDQLDRAITREEARVQNTLRETYRASVSRERSLRNQIGGLKADVLDLRRRSIQYNIIQREVDTNRQLYEALLQRYKEIGIAGGVGVNNISIVDVAETPETPSSPRLLLNLILALLAGTGLGFAAAFALEQIDHGIKDPSEVETALDVPLLGTVPKMQGDDPIEALSDRKSSVSEAYASLLTSLSFSTDHGVPRTLAVTSSRPAEGKTTTAYALASSLARSGKRVLLVDGDMRSPSIHEMFGLGNAAGLSNYLSGREDLAALVSPTSRDGLSIMPAGPQPPSTPELLSSGRFERMLAELAGAFDHIIIDAPPVMGLADAPLISSRVEGTVFIVESSQTNRGVAQVAIDRLLAANSQVLGAVLTKFNSKRAQYGYGYDYGYEYGHGEAVKAAT